MLSSVESNTQAAISALFVFLEAQGQGDYLGERITQLEHSLQCAHLARQSPEYGNDKEVVLAALLHDVGRFIPAANKMARMVGTDGKFIGRQSHEILGENYLRELGFSQKVCALVGAHVMAKRYLVATDKAYYDGLSETSKRTLGGVFTPEQIKEAQADRLLDAKLAVRRWDDQAKDPNFTAPPLEEYRQLAYECLLESRNTFMLHSREYHLPQAPTVVVCIDGFDPEYLASGIERNDLPTFKSMVENGFHATATSCMPSFTNPNNVSIITGAPPAMHGIAGNFFLDRATGKERMITDDTLLRGSTLLAKMAERGVRVAAITAKDKLRRILAHGCQTPPAICFSSERAAECTVEENGISGVEQWLGRPAPSQYSGDLSLYVLDAGIKLLQEERADFFYLTLSDFIQHKHEPGSKEADQFMKGIDDRLRELVELGAVVGATGDHGMSAKSNANGEPNILFLEDVLNERFGVEATRVICPITDPFVRHHGALGSFVRVYLKDVTQLESVISVCRSLPEVWEVLSGYEAARKYDMPPDREGDIVVISTANSVIGSSRAKHDLSTVKDHPLRSHGGLSEQDIPVITSRPVKDPEAAGARNWRNYDIFDLVLNCCA
ncbi:hypothetical protein AOCH_000056 [Aspergillus ochraceoroseus]|uniref:HD domain-containing protein n=1 Tax=Aspergillus ochraceoroseus TaxID=138278 RepID=A0A0F8UNW1_9EURO|nr:hypothetical protein AOCH_000056 [Aspergillus ochraceoroseus]